VDQASFFDQLRRTQLLPEPEVARLAMRFGPQVPVPDVAAALVEEGRLTPFQAKRLVNGRGGELVLGQYRLLEELGQGGFGHVYKALHVVMDRVVALKVIAPELVEDERARAWFKREVKTAAQLVHPNVVHASDASEADGRLFLVMEYVDGSDLDTLVRRRGPLPVALACEVMRQAALALQHAHEKGVVHRDVKPANLLIPRSPGSAGGGQAPVVVKVTDFGLARLHGPGRGPTFGSLGEGNFVGTPDYVAPEQARNSRSADIRSDLYSLGCTFYFALAGRKPFEAGNAIETLVKHLEEESVPVQAVRPEVPHPVAALVRRLMMKDPEKRFGTPAEFVAELEFFQRSEAAPAAPRTAAPEPAPTWEAPRPPAAAAPATTGATNVIPALAFADEGTWAAGAPAPDTLPAPSAGQLIATPIPVPRTVPEGLRPATVVLPQPFEPPVRPAGPAADAPADPPPTDEELRKGWQWWAAVVEGVSRGGDLRRLNGAAYRSLHGELVRGCRARASAAGPQQARYRRLEDLVAPWLTPEALAAADRATLQSLARACREAGRELGVPTGGRSGWWWAALIGGAVAAGVVWSLWGMAGGPTNLPTSLDSLWETARDNPVLAGIAALPLAVAGSIGALARFLRA
jgi:serine/threonine-protein kinase